MSQQFNNPSPRNGSGNVNINRNTYNVPNINNNPSNINQNNNASTIKNNSSLNNQITQIYASQARNNQTNQYYNAPKIPNVENNNVIGQYHQQNQNNYIPPIQQSQNISVPNNTSANRNQYPRFFDRNNHTISDYCEEGALSKQARNGFIKKVYTLLSLQLLFTVLICVWAMLDKQTYKNIFGNTAAIIILIVLFLIVNILLIAGTFCKSVMMKLGVPIFIAYTLIMSLLIGLVCCFTNPIAVVLAASLTLVITIILTIYACVTQTDLTEFFIYIIIFGFILISFGIALIFWRNPIMHLVYCCLAALFYGIYLIFDTQLVLGKFRYSFGLDDHYFAALMLYTDIIGLFLYILDALGSG